MRQQLAGIFSAPEIMLKLSRLSGLDMDSVGAALGRDLWNEMTSTECRHLMKLLLERAEIHEDGLTIEIRTEGIRAILDEVEYDESDDRNT